MQFYLELHTRAMLLNTADSRRAARDLTLSIASYRLNRWVITSIDTAVERVHQSLDRANTLKALSELDEHVLKVIGVQRGCLSAELSSNATVAKRTRPRREATLAA